MPPVSTLDDVVLAFKGVLAAVEDPDSAPTPLFLAVFEKGDFVDRTRARLAILHQADEEVADADTEDYYSTVPLVVELQFTRLDGEPPQVTGRKYLKAVQDAVGSDPHLGNRTTGAIRYVGGGKIEPLDLVAGQTEDHAHRFAMGAVFDLPYQLSRTEA